MNFWYVDVCQTKQGFVFINKFKHFLNNLTAFRNPAGCKNNNIDIDDHQYWSTKMIHLNSANARKSNTQLRSVVLNYLVSAVVRLGGALHIIRGVEEKERHRHATLSSILKYRAIWHSLEFPRSILLFVCLHFQA